MLFGKKESSILDMLSKQILKQSTTIKRTKLRFDRRAEKTLRDELRIYLSQQLDNRNNNVFSDLKFVDSKQNTLIQLADMVVGEIASSCSGKTKEYLKVLKASNKIEDIRKFGTHIIR